MANEKLPTVHFTSPDSESLATLTSAHTDLQFVVGCCERLQQDEEMIGEDPTYQRALWSASLIAYVRAIWDPRRRWIRKILEDRIAEFDGEPLVFHRFMKDMRDKYVSHSVNPYEDFRVGILLPPEGKDNEGVLGVGTLGMQLIHDKGNVPSLEKVCRALLVTLSEQIDVYRAKVMQEAKDVSVSELRGREPLKLTTPGPDKVSRPRKGGR